MANAITQILLLGHGKNHRKILSVHGNICHIDMNPTCDPDIVRDIRKEGLPNFEPLFDEVIHVCCCDIFLEHPDQTNYLGLRRDLITDIYNCLKPKGKFYLSNIYFFYPQCDSYQGMRTKLIQDIELHSDFKYLCDERKEDICKRPMLVFQK